MSNRDSEHRDSPATASCLAEIRRRVAVACGRCGRDPGEVTIVGASKGQPLARLEQAWAAGLRVFGENRVQEAEAKRPHLPHAIWHLIGPLQSNKVNKAVASFDVVQSVDRLSIAAALDRAAERAGRRLDCLLEVNLAGEDTKHGFAPGQLQDAAHRITGLTHLRLLGLMAIPPPGADAEGSRPWFRELRVWRDRLSAQLGGSFPGVLSMGMSDDFEVAVEEGASWVRIGTALFGARPGTQEVG